MRAKAKVRVRVRVRVRDRVTCIRWVGSNRASSRSAPNSSISSPSLSDCCSSRCSFKIFSRVGFLSTKRWKTYLLLG